MGAAEGGGRAEISCSAANDGRHKMEKEGTSARQKEEGFVCLHFSCLALRRGGEAVG